MSYDSIKSVYDAKRMEADFITRDIHPFFGFFRKRSVYKQKKLEAEDFIRFENTRHRERFEYHLGKYKEEFNITYSIDGNDSINNITRQTK